MITHKRYLIESKRIKSENVNNLDTNNNFFN